MTRFRQAAGWVATGAVLLAGCTAANVLAGGTDRAALNQPHKPFQIYGNTYYVGTAGLASILVVSDYGSVLIDGGLPDSARQIVANIRTLGFDPMEVKAILSSDPNADQAGGIAELQRLTGAPVYAMRASEQALLNGGPPKGDPQYGMKSAAFPRLNRVWIVQDDQLLGVGNVRMRVIATPGGTPGGTSWSWDACDGSKCLAAVYASNLAPQGARKYRYKDHPDVLKAFDSSFKRLEEAPCELLLTPHPQDSGGLDRLEQAGAKEDALKNDSACKAYVQQARENLSKRLTTEGG
jgi:metallo-beta-lactamase class B